MGTHTNKILQIVNKTCLLFITRQQPISKFCFCVKYKKISAAARLSKWL